MKLFNLLFPIVLNFSKIIKGVVSILFLLFFFIFSSLDGLLLFFLSSFSGSEFLLGQIPEVLAGILFREEGKKVSVLEVALDYLNDVALVVDGEVVALAEAPEVLEGEVVQELGS